MSRIGRPSEGSATAVGRVEIDSFLSNVKPRVQQLGKCRKGEDPQGAERYDDAGGRKMTIRRAREPSLVWRRARVTELRGSLSPHAMGFLAERCTRDASIQRL